MAAKVGGTIGACSQSRGLRQSQRQKPQPKPEIQADDLSSEKGVDYTKLRDLLKAGKWQEADYETYLVMIQAVGRQERPEDGYFRKEELLNFPCTDLRTIDRLWVKYSNGRFGFSVQKKIYLECGGKPDGEYYEEAWKKFGDRVGWRVNSSWIDYDDVTFDHLCSQGAPPRSPPSRDSLILYIGWVCGYVGICYLFSAHPDL